MPHSPTMPEVLKIIHKDDEDFWGRNDQLIRHVCGPERSKGPGELSRVKNFGIVH